MIFGRAQYWRGTPMIVVTSSPAADSSDRIGTLERLAVHGLACESHVASTAGDAVVSIWNCNRRSSNPSPFTSLNLARAGAVAAGPKRTVDTSASVASKLSA